MYARQFGINIFKVRFFTMKAVILSAGQWKRLMPLTADNPKCLLNINGQPLIEWQINELMRAGIVQISVVVGYQGCFSATILSTNSQSLTESTSTAASAKGMITAPALNPRRREILSRASFKDRRPIR